jgi:sugar phosphate isomerase/epimerase
MFDPVAIGIHTGPVSGRDGEEALVQAFRQIAGAATFLHPRPVDIALEPVGSGLHDWPVKTLADAARLLDKIALPNLRIVLDTAHLGDFTGQDDISGNLDKVALVQLADLPSPSADWYDRMPPGDGQLQFPHLLGWLHDLGYRGWYEMELWPRRTTSAADASASVSRAREYVRRIHPALPA